MIPRPARIILIGCMCLLAGRLAFSQTAQAPTDSPWVGQRIVMLKGMGEVHLVRRTVPVFATAVGINLVAPVSSREGQRLWIVSTSGADSGWVDSVDVLRLSDALPYFTRLIERRPADSVADLRRVQAQAGLNQRG